VEVPTHFTPWLWELGVGGWELPMWYKLMFVPAGYRCSEHPDGPEKGHPKDQHDESPIMTALDLNAFDLPDPRPREVR